MPSAALNWVRRHPRVGEVLLIFGAIFYTYQANGDRIDDQQRATQRARTELCQSIDADHNRQRDDIINGQRILYRVPAFRVLVVTPNAERAAYEQARHKYDAIRRTRPDFCRAIPNPVKPFPPLQYFRG